MNMAKNKIINYLTIKTNNERDEPVYEATKKDHWWNQYPVNPLGPYFGRRVGKEPETLQKAWKLFEALIVKMKWISEENNAKFVVFSEEGDNGIRLWSIKWNRIQTDGSSDFVFRDGIKYAVDWKRPLKNLEKICKRNGIPLIKPVRQYDRYDYDPHPNKIGNERMAQDVVDFLIKWKPFHKILNEKVIRAKRNRNRPE